MTQNHCTHCPGDAPLIFSHKFKAYDKELKKSDRRYISWLSLAEIIFLSSNLKNEKPPCIYQVQLSNVLSMRKKFSYVIHPTVLRLRLTLQIFEECILTVHNTLLEVLIKTH